MGYNAPKGSLDKESMEEKLKTSCCVPQKKSMDVRMCTWYKTGHVCNGFKMIQVLQCKQESTELGIDLQLGSSLLT
jgi:hypothetical protein